MNSDDLTRDQAWALKHKIGPMLNYLGRLQRRMRYRGFLENDPLLQRVVETTNAIHALHVDVHYLTCGDVTGPLPRKRKDQPQHDDNYNQAHA